MSKLAVIKKEMAENTKKRREAGWNLDFGTYDKLLERYGALVKEAAAIENQAPRLQREGEMLQKMLDEKKTRIDTYETFAFITILDELEKAGLYQRNNQ